MEQRQARADQIERTRPERFERVLENVVLEHLKIRRLEPLQVAGVDVGRDYLPGWTDLLGQPHCHRAAPRRDLQTPPPALNQRPPPARHWIVKLLEKSQALFLGRRPTRGSKAIARLNVDSLCTPGGGRRLRHDDNLASGAGSGNSPRCVLLVQAARTYPTFGFAAAASGLSASMGARVAFVKRATAAYTLSVKMSSVACCGPSVA
jgi:hypothetical protein